MHRVMGLKWLRLVQLRRHKDHGLRGATSSDSLILGTQALPPPPLTKKGPTGNQICIAPANVIFTRVPPFTSYIPLPLSKIQIIHPP